MNVFCNSTLQLSSSTLASVNNQRRIQPCRQVNIIGNQNTPERGPEDTAAAIDWLQEILSPAPYTGAIMIDIERDGFTEVPSFWEWSAMVCREAHPNATIGFYTPVMIHLPSGKLFESQPPSVLECEYTNAVFPSCYVGFDPGEVVEQVQRKLVRKVVGTNKLHCTGKRVIPCVSKHKSGRNDRAMFASDNVPIIGMREMGVKSILWFDMHMNSTSQGIAYGHSDERAADTLNHFANA